MDDGVTQSADRRTSAVLGRVIAGKFRIDSLVGGGAMGAVYKARQLALDKDVAIKVLHGEHAGDATFAARFQREARAASKLDHPNSMRVIDFGQEPDGLLYIAMEYLDGRDLFHVIRAEWPLPARRVADLVSQALAALAVAHEMGIVHRDLKPENIMVLSGTDDEGRVSDVVKVCDFGIAKFTEQREAPSGQKLTSQGIVVGTPEYMSPEQGKGESLDSRSDLYSMGVILYQMLTGRVPFDAETAIGVVLKHVTEDPVAPRQINAHADERLEVICLKAMRKKRDDRYATAREMRQDLRAVLGGTDPLAHAATQQFAAPAALGHASTALAIDSSKVVVAATASKLTPAGTVTDSGSIRTGRGRTFAVAAVGVAVAAGAFGAWKLRTATTASAPAAAIVASVRADTPSPPPAVDLKPTEVPPLDLPGPPASRGPLATTATAVRTTGPAAPLGEALFGRPPPPPSIPAPAPSALVVTTLPPPPSPAPLPPPVTATPAPPAAPAPTAVAFDPSRAHVDWSVVNAGGGATPGAVQRALSRTAGGWTQCYRTELGRRSARVEGSAVLHVTTDESGNVVGSSVRGFEAMPGVQRCIAGVARVRIDGVDTGDAWADVQLTFKAQ